MRVFFRRRERAERLWPVGGSTYRSASYRPLCPAQVRQRQFGWSRRGFDPIEVRQFLDRVAGDLAAAHDALANSRRDHERIRDALRRWQSEQFRTRLAEVRRAEREGAR
ncbi:DivIVA domain-containing protein [Micromonospora marina]|uniref:DivIVA domain-containing protein n=1 Tax=Micromonospora marina TaxID=307120 RepID=UPI0034567A52